MSLRNNYQTARNDFRSDTLTTPTKSMIEAVATASIGDAVYNEDDDTIDLEEKVANIAGKEAGLFCVSGTLSNQIALRTHLYQPPYSIICDYRAHIYCSEAAGIAMLSNAMVSPVIPSNGDYLTLEDIKKRFIPDDGSVLGAPTKLISLENTLHGVVYPLEELKRISKFCKEVNIPLHCDGARLWNASISTGVSIKEYGELFDTISLCLSKSLGAPIGSVLVGPKEFIRKANHFRKQNGGGIRQSGMLSRMAIVAIDENWSKVKEAHGYAKEFGDFVSSHGIVLESPVDTNFVFVDVEKSEIDEQVLLETSLKYNLTIRPSGRIAFHYQNDRESVDALKKVFVEALEISKARPESSQGDEYKYRSGY
ncbi:Low specificity L-threonine aldolase [Wickerhamomyces ciferrii]|uniref:low-specificity L-threonine aldolase n=1 Tax=Wickerhamomyces ciferrii (strain ATCC 14091 / BCRC 22168 / CBS 111 / JCM 3599 / NBRC 0793 / NRRL Y-1031 F-60-10) TaxID=1206466 RepID=K0KKE8_WICCF|nr:Low specificity L-threonine aldolase [Wickerhamomyces ciferrii]CCH42632.1 Low specificity L-threonine aldolase [Wickerhamomyces ciferrii]